jgi:hypothetical protein
VSGEPKSEKRLPPLSASCAAAVVLEFLLALIAALKGSLVVQLALVDCNNEQRRRQRRAPANAAAVHFSGRRISQGKKSAM